jgi:nitrile hydratase accessory protein
MSQQATGFFAQAQALGESLGSESGIAFAEPWQARAFAIAVIASRQGCFTWSEWTHALGRELQRSSDMDPKAAEANYFDCWLSALRALLLAKGNVGQAELHERKHAWEDAYRRTPHGVPVSLSRP